MLRKTLVVVGTLVAATVLSGGPAAASWHHHLFHRFGHHHERFAGARIHHRRFASRRFGRGEHHRYAYGPRRLRALRSYAAYQRAAARQAYAAATPASGGYAQTGSASYYSGGGRTAAGGHVGFATCAHRSLPFGTRVLVTNLANLRQTVLTVNDRGPFVRGRMLDVSRGAAGILGMIGSGVAHIRMQVVGGPA